MIQDPPLRTPKGVLTGLHTVVQLSEGLGLWNRGLVLGILHAVGLVARRISYFSKLENIKSHQKKRKEERSLLVCSLS